MRFIYHKNSHLPRLAWCAVLTGRPFEARIYHGSAVETFDSFFVEGAWDGKFLAGDFDKTTFFMGSGGKLDSTGSKVLVFSTPTHTLERLYSMYDNGNLYISNSLPFILQMTGQRPDPGYMDYERDFNSILKGLDRYKRDIPLENNRSVRLHYCYNLVVEKTLAVTEEAKITPGPFVDYADYYNKLTQALGHLISNAGSPARRVRYGMVATISKGYDSAACAALARDLGCETVVSFNCPEQYINDCGDDIAIRLGYKNIVLKSADEYLSNSVLAEAEFVASGELGSDIVFSAFEREYEGNLVFTGNFGDTMWDKNERDANSQLRCINGGYTETCHAEYRLRIGYIAVFPASFGAVEWPSVHAISNSAEMKRYSTGTAYDRPIPRRILEDRGVSREMFGMCKSGAGFNYRHYTLNKIKSRMAPPSFLSFHDFYKTHRRRGFRVLLRWALYIWQTKSVFTAYFLNKIGIPVKYKDLRCDVTPNPGAPSYLFAWGVNELIKRYKAAMEKESASAIT